MKDIKFLPRVLDHTQYISGISSIVRRRTLPCDMDAESRALIFRLDLADQSLCPVSVGATEGAAAARLGNAIIDFGCRQMKLLRSTGPSSRDDLAEYAKVRLDSGSGAIDLSPSLVLDVLVSGITGWRQPGGVIGRSQGAGT
jgi:hypothetical protein